MLLLYNTNHGKIGALTNYKDYHIEQVVNIDDLLYFSYPIADPQYAQIAFECYIRDGVNEYVIKEINIQGAENGIEWAQIICKINLEDLKGRTVASFVTVEQKAEDAANLALAGTGWTVGYCDVTKLRTVRKAQCSAYDVLSEIAKSYTCEITYNAIAKTVIIHQKQGADRGAYFAEQLNLKQLQSQGNSNGYVTRLIPIGKDGLDITSVSAGINYVSNYQYSTKVITGYWVDNRYTVAQDLKDDAIERLAYLSKPTRAYAASIIDLANVSDDWGILDFALGDFITLLSESQGVREQQRIVKIDRYPEEPERSTIQIANRIVSLEDIILRMSDATDTVELTTDTAGSVVASSVAGNLNNAYIAMANVGDLNVTIADIGTLIATKATITSLDAINANIANLTATKANVTELTAATGRIGVLEVNSATIIQLNASTARIVTLETNVASINTLLAGNIGAANLAAGAIQAGSAVIATGAIGSAQIISLDVLKLDAGNISTNKFTIQSDNGNLRILGDTIKLWDMTGKERVSLGLNGADYNLLIRGIDGITVLFGTDGVTHAGITQGAVDDTNVAVNANINGEKIEKESLVFQINGATTLLKSSHVIYDPTGQTFEVAFGALSTTVTNQGTTVSDQATSISVLQGQIVTKVTQTDISDYVSSRGENLVTNGTGLLGDNTNFSGLVFDKSDNYGSAGSFTTSAYNGALYDDEFIPVNPDLNYKMTWYGKTNPYVGAHFYGMVACYDSDKNQILPGYTMYKAGTQTTLKTALNVGDTVINLTSATNWLDYDTINGTVNTYLNSMIVWNYTSAGGYLYPPLTYSRNYFGNVFLLGSINFTTSVVTLRVPWAGAVIPMGTSVSQGNVGGSFKYIAGYNVTVPATWTKYSGNISGTDYTGTNNMTKFQPATAFVKIGWLVNRDVTGSKIFISNISFGLDNADKADLDAIDTRVSTAETTIIQNTNSITLKASQTSLDTTNSNVTTAQTQANLGVTNAATAQTQANLGVTNAATAKTQADLGVANALIAQTQANTATTNAAAAQTAANGAQTTANTAKAYTDNLALDTVITPDEKYFLKREWDLIVVDGFPTTGKIPVQATLFTVADTVFDTAYDALKVYLLTTLDLFTAMTTPLAQISKRLRFNVLRGVFLMPDLVKEVRTYGLLDVYHGEWLVDPHLYLRDRGELTPYSCGVFFMGRNERGKRAVIWQRS